MLFPEVAARMKERHHLIGHGIDRTKITSLGSVTFETAQAKVLACCGAAVLLRSNMIDFMLLEGIALVQQAVLTLT